MFLNNITFISMEKNTNNNNKVNGKCQNIVYLSWAFDNRRKGPDAVFYPFLGVTIRSQQAYPIYWNSHAISLFLQNESHEEVLNFYFLSFEKAIKFNKAICIKCCYAVLTSNALSVTSAFTSIRTSSTFTRSLVMIFKSIQKHSKAFKSIQKLNLIIYRFQIHSNSVKKY
ncbi:hypothetical protein K501DRAFT_276324 [Backusella circina FSU 941]|nr:hypothetical protein K501DRAFT_276324 [Backusella circina FSU 941]